jgi:flagella basal body P-ring formation protein FlgA
MFRYLKFGFIICLVMIASIVEANQPSIVITGRKDVLITNKEIRLSDLADVMSKNNGQEEEIIALKKIKIFESPAPNSSVTFSAAQILEKLSSNGVNLKEIGYTIPRVITVKRVGRAIEKHELHPIVEEILSNSANEVNLKELVYNKPIYVAPGAMKLSAQIVPTKSIGQLGFRFTASNLETDETVNFEVTANIEEWREVPVAAKSIGKGSVIDPADVQMARLNITELPKDAAIELENIYGLSATQSINLGEVFRKSKLLIPPVITAGSPVTMVYRSGALEATASAVALESGAMGDEIKVRNNSSKKILIGKVIEPGLVGVSK